MTQFNSPALYQPEVPHSVALARAVLAVLAVLATVGTWGALGALAGHPTDDSTHIELAPVVISLQRDLADGAAMALVSTRAGIDCANPLAFPMSSSRNGVNLKQ